MSAMRFTQIALKNWRNFTNVDVPLANRVFLVGPNASGKSNFLDAFRFLRDLVTEGGGLAKAVKKEKLPWVFPVGRLDKDTSGLLLLTNDTAFGDFVTDPASRVPKTYLAKISGLLDEQTLARLNAGVEMKRGDWARPESVRRVEDRGKYTWLEIVLTEGKNREVRRLIEAVGFKVLKLVRTRIGPLTLAGLEVGAWRALTSAEVAALRSSAGYWPRGRVTKQP